MTKSQTKGARFGLAILGAGLMLPAAPAVAQTAPVFAETPSQALSRHLKSLAANPQSLAPLMGAGQAALSLGDAQAALTFFGRAEEIAPRDGRIKMWMGAALVHLQQPQGALRFFDQAISLGAAEADVAAERGLAWDISGDPSRAQRDYRLALQKGANAEVTRRLALSLAISGQREEAMRLLDEQLRVRNRDAERTRVLILALTGDSAGAARAVQASMPGGRGSAMAPFLERLAALNLAERASAVHLGVFPQARTGAPSNAYAAADPVAAGAADPRQAGLGRTPTPKLARREPAPAGPSSRVTWSAGSRALGTMRREAEKPATVPAKAEPKPAAAAPAPTQLARLEPAPAAAKHPVTPPSTTIAASTPVKAPVVTPPSAMIAASTPVQAPAMTPTSTTVATSTPVQAPAAQPVAAASPPVQRAEMRQPQPVALPPSQAAAAAFELARVDPALTAPEPAPAPVEAANTSRLADVVATVAALPEIVPEKTAPAAKPAAPAPAKPAAPKAAAAKTAAASAAKAPAATDAAPKGVRTAAATKPAARDAKAAAAAKPVKDKPAAKQPVEPARIWVQVAGGAQKAALPQEFARLKAKAPKLLAARTAWTTPLKATNRLLVGPFKTEKEAQEFVNELAKSKLSAFAWTSEAGQKIEKLAAK